MALYKKEGGSLYFREEFYLGGIGTCFDVDDVLFDDYSPYQHIQVFTNGVLVRVLVIDGVIQTTYLDEKYYHGPMAGLSVGLHTTNPGDVLIVGGGDWGVLHQVLKYRIKHVTIVEIDEMVTKVCRKHLPRICEEIPPERSQDVRLVYEDASEFIQNARKAYDVVIVDSSEPIGPGEPLFGRTFYQNVLRHLRSDGIILAQAGSLVYGGQWLKTFRLLSSLDPGRLDVRVFHISVPTYGGDFALVGARRDKRFPSEGELIKMLCRGDQVETEWNSPERYRAYQVLPPPATKLLCKEMQKA